jgi:hypothetical protein
VNTARRIAILALTAIVAFVLVRAFMPSTWHSQLATPLKLPNQYVVYHCGAAFGSATVRGPPTTAYRLEGSPCDTRRQLQIMTVVDVVLGGAGIVALGMWGRRQADEVIPAESPSA